MYRVSSGHDIFFFFANLVKFFDELNAGKEDKNWQRYIILFFFVLIKIFYESQYSKILK